MALFEISSYAPTGMDCVKLLVEKGKADIRGKCAKDHSSLFPYVAGSLPMMHYLIDAGVDPKETNDPGKTVLFKLRHRSSWDFYVQQGEVDINHVALNGQTAIFSLRG